jgi:hypothetical protein
MSISISAGILGGWTNAFASSCHYSEALLSQKSAAFSLKSRQSALERLAAFANLRAVSAGNFPAPGGDRDEYPHGAARRLGAFGGMLVLARQVHGAAARNRRVSSS